MGNESIIGHVNVGFSTGEKKSPGPHSSKKQWPSTDSDPPAYNEAIREEGDGMDIDLVGPESEEERIMLVVGYPFSFVLSFLSFLLSIYHLNNINISLVELLS